MRRRIFNALANAICRWPWLFVAAGVALAAGAATYAARHLDFQTGRTGLIGRESEYWRLFSEYAREFHSEEDFIIVVESDRPERNQAVVDAFADALLSPANNPGAEDKSAAQQFTADDVFYRVDFDAMQRWFLYYLSVNDLTRIRDSLKDFKQLVDILQRRPKLDEFFDAMIQMLATMETAPEADRRNMESFLPTITGIVRQMNEFQGNGAKDQLLSPWAGAFFSEEMVGEAEQQMKWHGYQTFRDGRMFIMLIHPRAYDNISVPQEDAATTLKLQRIIADVQRQFSDVRIGLTGEPVLNSDEMRLSQRDAERATLLTLLLVGALFAFGFRELIRPALAVVSIVLVIAMSMGYAALSIGHLNIITVTFAVMIVGLGIDLGIQLIARYEEELSRGADRATAVHHAIEQTGSSIATAGVTNAAAFFAMGLSGFRGVIELGVIAGGGMLIATAVMLLVLPALLMAVRRKHESTSIPARAAATRFEQLLLRKPVAVLAVCAAITVAALLVGWRVSFDYNVLNLQSKNLPSVETELRLLKADAESTIYAAVVCDTFEETRVLQHSLARLPTVATVHSIAELIPEGQEAKVKIIREIQAELGDVHFKVEPPDPADVDTLLQKLGAMRLRAGQLARQAAERGDAASERVLTPLVEALKQARETLQAVDRAQVEPWLALYERRFFSDLEAQLQLMANQVVDRPMSVDDVPREVRPMLIGKTGKFLVRVFPKENIWEREPLERFVRDVQSVAPKATGTPLGLYEFVDILQRGYINAAWIAFLVIAALIFVDFRGWYATMLTLLPLVAGMIWMVGALALFGIPFNPANIMVLPLLVGIGVAYGIYVVQRYREDGEASFYGKSTGRAVILSALVTIVAFGSLIFGAHRGIRSLGLVMIIGISACLVAALVLLPALLEIARRKGWKV